MYEQDPETISFNPHHHHQNQNPNFAKWGAENRADKYEHNLSYINGCSDREKGITEINYEDSGGPESPRLWKNSPSPSRPLLRSENSRAEAIVRGQWELMEMVKKMPDDSYELSLKDMVEHQRSIESAVGSSSVHQRAVAKRDEQSRKIDRNLSFENKGMLLNMVFPFSFKSRKRDSSVRVSGKSERDWWKKKFRGSSDSDTSGVSTSSSGATSSSGGSDTARRYVEYLKCWLRVCF